MSDEPIGPDGEQRAGASWLRIAVYAVLGGMVGIVTFAFGGSLIGCLWLWPDSNLCGLPAWLLAIPIGGPLGACVGGLIAAGAKSSRVPPVE